MMSVTPESPEVTPHMWEYWFKVCADHPNKKARYTLRERAKLEPGERMSGPHRHVTGCCVG